MAGKEDEKAGIRKDDLKEPARRLVLKEKLEELSQAVLRHRHW